MKRHRFTLADLLFTFAGISASLGLLRLAVVPAARNDGRSFFVLALVSLSVLLLIDGWQIACDISRKRTQRTNSRAKQEAGRS